jgi:hypothetical protein
MISLLVSSTIASAQMSVDDVDGLTIQNLSNSRVKLTWKSEPSLACVYDVTYSVFRSSEENFEPNESNRVVVGVKNNSVSLNDTKDSYYLVRSVHTPVHCVPVKEPGYHGTMTISPIAGDAGTLLVSLRTKWRLETTQKGALSYIIRGLYLGSGDAANYYTQARKCSYSLQLLDAQGFKITEISVNILSATGDAGKVVGLEANDIATLTIEQNRDFANGGDWNLAWTCPKW